MKFPPFRKPSEVNSPIPRARGACRPAASPRPERSTQYLRQTTPADLAYRGGRVPQENSSQSGHSFRCSSKSLLFPSSSVSDLIGRFGTIRLEPNHTVVDRLLLLLEQILEDEPTPSLAACVHQRATLVELSQLDGCEPKFFGQIRHGSDRVLVVARQKDDPVAALDDRVGSQCGRNRVVKTFHQLSAGERLRNECGGRKTVQLLRGNSERVRRVDDCLAFPARQGLRNPAMFPERNRQDDCVSLECIPQRLGDDRGSNRPSLRCQRLGGPATRNGHVDVFTGEGVGEGLTYLSESYNCIAHNVSPILVDIDSQPSTARDINSVCGDLP